MAKYVNVLSAACFLITLVSCTGNGSPKNERQFLELADMDSTVRPGDNFFLYANGSWLKNAQIPPTQTDIGSFPDLGRRTGLNLAHILHDLSRHHHISGSLEQKVGDFYASGMDSMAIEGRGYEPVKPYLQRNDAIKDIKGLLQFVAAQLQEGEELLLGQSIGADEKNSGVNIAGYYQAGLGMPDKDYYFKTDSATAAIVKAYRQYMRRLFVLTGDDPRKAAEETESVYNLERDLAGSHRSREELRDPQSNYHKMAVTDLNRVMPAVGWSSLLAAIGVKADSVNIGQPAYYARLNELLERAPLGTWKIYLRFHVLDNAADALSSSFVNARFEYSGKALHGQQRMKPRWEDMVGNTDACLGEALGQLYVKKYFTEDARKRVLELVNNLQSAFDARISQLDWMTDSTKQKAREKLHAFLKK